MSVEFDRESPGKFDSRTLSRKTLSRWTGRMFIRQSFEKSEEVSARVRDRVGALARSHGEETNKTNIYIYIYICIYGLCVLYAYMYIYIYIYMYTHIQYKFIYTRVAFVTGMMTTTAACAS